MLLCAITDRRRRSTAIQSEAAIRRRLLDLVQDWTAGGVHFIQLREKDLSAPDLQSFAGEVAEKIDAVSTKDVVESIIKTHLIRDIMGNMKKYATQTFKCRGCGRSFRRPTISGRCDFCGQDLRQTLTRGSVEKYLSLARTLASDYDVDDYIKGRLDLIVRELDQLFHEQERSTQLELTDFVPVLP